MSRLILPASVDPQVYASQGPVKRETGHRLLYTANQAIVSGRMDLYSLGLDSNDVLSGLCTRFSAAPAAILNLWYALYDAAGNLVAVTTDATTVPSVTAIAQRSFASPIRPPSSGLYYVGVVVVAGTPGSIRSSNAGNVNGPNTTPVVGITGGANLTGLITPGTAPSVANFGAALGTGSWVGAY